MQCKQLVRALAAGRSLQAPGCKGPGFAPQNQRRATRVPGLGALQHSHCAG